LKLNKYDKNIQQLIDSYDKSLLNVDFYISLYKISFLCLDIIPPKIINSKEFQQLLLEENTKNQEHTKEKQIDECYICYEKFDKNIIVLKCGHVFCYKCISQWLFKHDDPYNTCPMCRQKI